MNIETVRQKLLEAINDHPNNGITNPSGLLVELHKKMSSPITYEKLKRYSKTISLSTNAWEAESITSLLDVFEDNEDKCLEEIITLISISPTQ